MKNRTEVLYLPLAQADLEEIFDHVRQDSPAHAEKLLAKLDRKLSRLAEFPQMGMVPKDARLQRDGYRVVVINSYLVFYMIVGRVVQIHRVIHGARNYASLILDK